MKTNFTKTIPKKPGFYWVDLDGEGDYEVMKVTNINNHYTEQPDYLVYYIPILAGAVREEVLLTALINEGSGLICPRISLPTEDNANLLLAVPPRAASGDAERVKCSDCAHLKERHCWYGGVDGGSVTLDEESSCSCFEHNEKS